MLTRHRLRRAALPAAALTLLLVLGPVALAKKKTSGLKDGRYTFKLTTGQKGKVTVSGGGKKVRFSIPHFKSGAPGQFPYCRPAVIDHGSYTLKRDYVDKTKLAWADPDLYVRKAPPIETDGSAGGGMSANGTIDPKTLEITGEFQLRMQDVPGGINTCFEAPSAIEAKLVRAT